jgi:hypothetical protein
MQSQVAARAGVTQPYISEVLRSGDRFRSTSRLGVVRAANRDTVKNVLHDHGAENVAVLVPRRLLKPTVRETAERTMVLLRAAPTANTSRTRRPISPLLQD